MYSTHSVISNYRCYKPNYPTFSFSCLQFHFFFEKIDVGKPLNDYMLQIAGKAFRTLIFFVYLRTHHFTRFSLKNSFGNSSFLNLRHYLLGNTGNCSIFMINTPKNSRSQLGFKELPVDRLFSLLFWTFGLLSWRKFI